MNTNSTPYSNVNEILNILLTRVQEILGNQLMGMYLYGSLSSGDFSPETSDIDFVVVTANSLAEEKAAALETMHRGLWSSGRKWASKLEGAYVPKELIRRHDPNGAACPAVNEGQFYVAHLGSDWIIQRHIVRECGIVLSGPDPKTLIDPVDPDGIHAAVLGILEEWWFPMLDDPSWLANHGSEYHAFAILTMCRALYALKYGSIVSKPKAIQWARQTLDEPWIQLIDKAVLAARHECQDNLLSKALGFIQFTKEQVLELGKLKGVH